ncbi:MAG: Panacea domain-containing protein [Chloroflexota bacterium]
MHNYLDTQKALEAIVYVSQKTNNLFNVVKTLYFADKFHLENYGRLITGDRYIAMEDGPVPSGAYDLIKFVRGDEFTYNSKIIDAHPEKAIKVVRDGKETMVSPLREYDPDYLSESDIECLDKSIELFAKMNTSKLWDIVHQEEAYKKTPPNKTMPISEIILSLPNGKDVLEFLNS